MVPSTRISKHASSSSLVPATLHSNTGLSGLLDILFTLLIQNLVAIVEQIERSEWAEKHRKHRTLDYDLFRWNLVLAKDSV